MKYMKINFMEFLALGIMAILPLSYCAYGYFWAHGYLWGDMDKFHLIQVCQGLNPALTTADVVNLLGRPSHIEESATTGIKSEAYFYHWHNSEAKIVFLNGDLFLAEYLPEKNIISSSLSCPSCFPVKIPCFPFRK